LDLGIVREAVASSDCSCEHPSVCYRRLAWRLLEREDIRLRVNDLLRVVHMQGQPVLFRELWDFLADLITGGSCDDRDVPTTAWFWRVFYGDSELSRRLRAVTDARAVVFPHAEAHAWFGDWFTLEKFLLEGVRVIPLGDARTLTDDQFTWIKSQLFFVTNLHSTQDVIRDQVDLALVSALQKGHKQEIVAAINRYMIYGTRQAAQQVLQLWADLGVERRLQRVRGQVSLGEVKTAELELQTSTCIVNHPNSSLQIPGSQHFLVHGISGASFRLAPDILNLLRGGRSYRHADRQHTDLEWHLGRFFSQIGSVLNEPDELRILSLDFREMTSALRGYRVSLASQSLEPAGGV
jgi:hypothetical protein